MDITMFESFPEINFMGERYVQINNTDFMELKPILDLCRVHNKTLLISFSESDKKNEKFN